MTESRASEVPARSRMGVMHGRGCCRRSGIEEPVGESTAIGCAPPFLNESTIAFDPNEDMLLSSVKLQTNTAESEVLQLVSWAETNETPFSDVGGSGTPREHFPPRKGRGWHFLRFRPLSCSLMAVLVRVYPRILFLFLQCCPKRYSTSLPSSFLIS